MCCLAIVLISYLTNNCPFVPTVGTKLFTVFTTPPCATACKDHWDTTGSFFCQFFPYFPVLLLLLMLCKLCVFIYLTVCLTRVQTRRLQVTASTESCSAPVDQQTARRGTVLHSRVIAPTMWTRRPRFSATSSPVTSRKL